jgi:hypothetical protein
VLAAVGVVALAAAAVFAVTTLGNDTGVLLVTAPDGPSATTRVFVDGEPRCEALPCRIEGLTKGVRSVSYAAAGEPMSSPRAIAIVPGEEASMVVELTHRESAPVAAAKSRFMLRLSAGAGANDAEISVSQGDDQRVIASLPTTLELALGELVEVRATRNGYRSFERKLEDPRSDQEITIELEPVAQGMLRVATPGPSDSPKPAEPQRPVASAKKPAAELGTLNLNSIPRSRVLLNGRPVGETPKTGVQVPAGTHQVLFIHPEHGRKQVTVTVTAGGTAAASTRFP